MEKGPRFWSGVTIQGLWISTFSSSCVWWRKCLVLHLVSHWAQLYMGSVISWIIILKSPGIWAYFTENQPHLTKSSLTTRRKWRPTYTFWSQGQRGKQSGWIRSVREIIVLNTYKECSIHFSVSMPQVCVFRNALSGDYSLTDLYCRNLLYI